MKTIHPSSVSITRSRWLSLGFGCALACAPLGTASLHAQGDDAAKQQAAQPQPGDPAESKKGALNEAKPGGTEKLTSKEVTFIKEAGSGNVAEIRLGELALKNSENQTVKDYAQKMIDDHSKANDQLAEVAKNHNITFPPDATDKQKAVGLKLIDLKGAAFDKEYMKAMVKSHKMVLAEYKKALGEFKDPKLAEYVKQTEPIVASHTEMAEKNEPLVNKE